jgi:predicted RNase H-like nuclease (RuvC/YqgF family)|tara:strand:- start:1217 stop:1405 length:189 start_codon:yes stop_codon:yes gene_type:complete
MEYPKPRWDLENDVLRLEQMIHLYQEEIQKLEVENEELQQKVAMLTRKIKYYKIKEELDEEG